MKIAPQRGEAQKKGCTCQWDSNGSIIAFAVDCPILDQHYARNEDLWSIGPHPQPARKPSSRLPRTTRKDTFLDIAQTISRRSTCLRGNVGCVIVKDDRIVSMGYNGAPPGHAHCLDVGCQAIESGNLDWNEPDLLRAFGCQRAIHAEANALAFAARHGVSVEGATVYCTHGPCVKCAQLMVSAGIKSSIFDKPYRDPRGAEMMMNQEVS